MISCHLLINLSVWTNKIYVKDCFLAYFNFWEILTLLHFFAHNSKLILPQRASLAYLDCDHSPLWHAFGWYYNESENRYLPINVTWSSKMGQNLQILITNKAISFVFCCLCNPSTARIFGTNWPISMGSVVKEGLGISELFFANLEWNRLFPWQIWRRTQICQNI